MTDVSNLPMPATDATDAEIEGAFNAASQDPDTDTVCALPNNMFGAQLLRKQTITASVNKGSSAYTGKLDVYVVVWPFEPVEGELTNLYATVLKRQADDTYVSYASPSWANPLTENSLLVGGIVAYVMRENQSPFPISSGGIIGPCLPENQIRLFHGRDFLSIGDLNTVIGGNFKLNATSPEITFSGSVTQSTFPNFTQKRENFYVMNGPGDSIIYSMLRDALRYEGFAPSEAIAVKYPKSKVRSAYDGCLNIIPTNISDESVTEGQYLSYLFKNNQAAPDGNFYDYSVGTAEYSPPIDIDGNVFATALRLYGRVRTFPTTFSSSMSIITGLTHDFSYKMSRTTTAIAFVDPSSEFITFAKQSPPYDTQAMQAIINALHADDLHWAACDNDHGDASKRGKKLFRKALKGAKKIAKATPMGAKVVKAADKVAKVATVVNTLSNPARNRSQPPSKATGGNSTQVNNKQKVHSLLSGLSKAAKAELKRELGVGSSSSK